MYADQFRAHSLAFSLSITEVDTCSMMEIVAITIERLPTQLTSICIRMSTLPLSAYCKALKMSCLRRQYNQQHYWLTTLYMYTHQSRIYIQNTEICWFYASLKLTEHVWILIFLLYKKKKNIRWKFGIQYKSIQFPDPPHLLTSKLDNALTDCTHLGMYG